MKKLYSVILLASFMIGAIQPIIPVIEYHLFKESIIELFCVNRDQPEIQCEGVCYLSSQIEKNEEDQTGLKTFNVDYYPVGLSLDLGNNPGIFPRDHKLMASEIFRLEFVHSQPLSPPPKVS
jgi:hypothetical protein